MFDRELPPYAMVDVGEDIGVFRDILEDRCRGCLPFEPHSLIFLKGHINWKRLSRRLESWKKNVFYKKWQLTEFPQMKFRLSLVNLYTAFKRTFVCHIDKCYKVFEAENELKKHQKLHVKKRPKRDPFPKAACDASQKDQEFNASNVVKLLSQRFPIQQADDQFTDAEETICNSIIGYICDLQEAQESLIYDLLDDDRENVSSDSSEDYREEEVARSSQRFRYTRKQMEDIIKDYGLYGLTYVQRRYRKINSRNDIVRMRQYLEGSPRLAEAEVKKELFIAFEDWMNKGYHINDRDLHLEAVEIARRKNHIHFKASPHFIFRFKKKYRIVSRKITHVTTKKSFVDREHQREICEKFRNEMKSLIANHTDKGKIFNSDQTGLRLELRSGRTLAYKGSRHVEVLVQRKNALTHSLTLQPVISADGYLQTPMLVCFMERKPPARFPTDLQEFNGMRMD
ncbi:hypothetical protein QR680_017330 [Steinernema hermaphroditum]|uniref:C2H2-type domain-containing protein n=1 Tax=Steinernema hermaphroditum TaxID=289476 RepID=A0AA39HG61_9BILA|nr:hypothetical protein QR680_017330 [Steinernema hermaphroditum]